MAKKNNRNNFNIRNNRNRSNEGNSLLFGNTSEIVESLVNVSSGLDSILVNIDDLYEAPVSWNFYTKLPDGKMQELIESIAHIGLQQPIIVWEREDEQNEHKYMILSGHNRVRAVKELRRIFNDDKYNKIHAVIKKDIQEFEAKEIIVDTNWVERTLTPMEKAKSIMFKYNKNKIEARKNKERVNINKMIAENYNIKSRQVIDYKNLNNLTEKAAAAVDNGLAIKAGVFLSKLNNEDQDYIVDMYPIEILNKSYGKIKTALNKDTIDKEKLSIIMEEEISRQQLYKEEQYKSITISFPSNNNEFLEKIKELAKEYGAYIK